MKYIHKNNPPTELIIYRNSAGASYKDMYDNHRDLYELTRLSLAEEQGYICCYCGQRITGFQGTQIEHIFAKGTAAYSKMQLDYETNLLACCDGGKLEHSCNPSILTDHFHCDTKKHNDPIPVTPLQKDCQGKFMFDTNGDILGVGTDAEATIEILNLNSVLLKNKRKAVLNAYIDYPVLDWQAEYDSLFEKDGLGMFKEFCFVRQMYIELFHSDKIVVKSCT